MAEKKRFGASSSFSFDDLMKRGADPLDASNAFRTGILAIDFAFGKECCADRGSSILVWGEEGYGKSTILAQVARMLGELGERCAYLDPEGGSESYYKSYAIARAKEGKNPLYAYFGPRQDILYYSDVVKFMMNEVIKPHEEGRPDAIQHVFLDSLNKLKPNPRDVVDSSTGQVDGRMGASATLTQQFYDLFQPICKKYGVTLWCIAQARANIDVSNPNATKYTPIKVAASHGVKHSQDVVIQLMGRPTTTGNVENGAFFGETDDLMAARRTGRSINILCSKNRSGVTHFKIPMVLRFGYGASNAHFRQEMLKWSGVLKQGGAWLTLTLPGDEERKFQGSDGFIKAYRSDTALSALVSEYCVGIAGDFYDFLSSGAYDKR